MIAGFHGIIAAEKTPVVVTPSGQTVNVNFDDQKRVEIPNWNTWIGSASNQENLLNTAGSPSGLYLQFVDGNFGAEGEGEQLDPASGDPKKPYALWPVAVLAQMINRGSADIATRLTGASASKSYRFTFAAVQNYNDAGDRTDIILNGVSTPLNGPDLANVLYTKTIVVANPPAGIIDIVFHPTAGSAGYSCMSAMIIEEF